MASTTGLLDAHERTWALDLLAELDLPAAILPPLARPGEVIGGLRDEVAAETGLSPGVDLTLVGSHDTASAVVAVPAEGSDFAYISSGTWSLVGVELDAPVLTEASRLAQFTNERGVDDRVRYLRNVMGLWLLQETLRAWERRARPRTWLRCSLAAARAPAGGPSIEPNDTDFLPPGDMPARIADACRRTDQPVRGRGRRWSAASSTASRSRTPGRSTMLGGCPGARSGWSTSSAAEARTRCSAS